MKFKGEILLTLETDILLNNILIDRFNIKVDIFITELYSNIIL